MTLLVCNKLLYLKDYICKSICPIFMIIIENQEILRKISNVEFLLRNNFLQLSKIAMNGFLKVERKVKKAMMPNYLDSLQP